MSPGMSLPTSLTDMGLVWRLYPSCVLLTLTFRLVSPRDLSFPPSYSS